MLRASGGPLGCAAPHASAVALEQRSDVYSATALGWRTTVAASPVTSTAVALGKHLCAELGEA